MAAAPEGFDLAALLAPIAGSSPVGADLREDFTPQSPYYRLRDARAEARAAERAQDSSGSDDPPPAQWRSVRDLASKALAGTTKDLEIACWYTEALVRSDGLDGLAAGAALIEGLAANFWDSGLYPLPDEDGIATLVAPITGLNGQGGDGTLVQPLRKLTLFRRPTGEPLYYYQYEDAETVAGIADLVRRKSRLTAGSLPLPDVENWARAAGQAHFADLRQRATGALNAWLAMATTLDAKAGYDSPSTSRIRDMLTEICTVIAKYAPALADAPDEAEIAADATGGEASGGTAVAGTGAPAPARVVTRDDMLRDLARIADWFRKTEPHSPLAYTLDDAVRRDGWAGPDLLAEMVGDVNARKAILNSLGIKPPEPG